MRRIGTPALSVVLAACVGRGADEGVAAAAPAPPSPPAAADVRVTEPVPVAGAAADADDARVRGLLADAALVAEAGDSESARRLVDDAARLAPSDPAVRAAAGALFAAGAAPAVARPVALRPAPAPRGAGAPNADRAAPARDVGRDVGPAVRRDPGRDVAAGARRPAAPRLGAPLVTATSDGAVGALVVRTPSGPALPGHMARPVAVAPVAPRALPTAPARRSTRRWGAAVGASAGVIAGGLIGNIPGLLIMGAISGAAGARKTEQASAKTAARDSAIAADRGAAAPPRPGVPRVDTTAPPPARGARPAPPRP